RAFLTENLIPPRTPDAEITEDHKDAAAALQACLDRTVTTLCGNLAGRTGLRRLALAGGVALNCTAHGKLVRTGQVDGVYVQPAAGDDGAALGAALVRASVAGQTRNMRMPTPFLGPRHGAEAIDEALEAFAPRLDVTRFDSVAAREEAARLIAGGHVIAWY